MLITNMHIVVAGWCGNGCSGFGSSGSGGDSSYSPGGRSRSSYGSEVEAAAVVAVNIVTNGIRSNAMIDITSVPTRWLQRVKDT